MDGHIQTQDELSKDATAYAAMLEQQGEAKLVTIGRAPLNDGAIFPAASLYVDKYDVALSPKQCFKERDGDLVKLKNGYEARIVALTDHGRSAFVAYIDKLGCQMAYSITPSDLAPPPVWTCTPELRIVVGPIIGTRDTLEQRWNCHDGRSEWRELERVHLANAR